MRQIVFGNYCGFHQGSTLARRAARVALLVLLVLCLPALLSIRGFGQAQSDAAVSLALNQPIETEIKGGEKHTYGIFLNVSQFVQVIVDQRGVDLIVTLNGPKGEKLSEVDSPTGTKGPEQLSWIAETAGPYRWEIRPLQEKATPGRYEVKIGQLRDSKPEDNKIVAAERASAEAARMLNAGTKESQQTALRLYEKALDLWRQLGDRSKEALALEYLGLAYYSLDQPQKTLGLLNQALALRKEIGDLRGQADTLGGLGLVYRALGEKRKTLEALNQSLLLHRSLADSAGELTMLEEIAQEYESQGEKQRAVEFYGQVLLRVRALGPDSREATILSKIGRLNISLEQWQKGIEALTPALSLLRKENYLGGEVIVLNDLGFAHKSLRQPEKALDYYSQSREILRSKGSKEAEAVVVGNIGALYDSLGERQKALEYLIQALTLYQSVGNREGEAKSLMRIGATQKALGDWRKAIEYYDKALPLFRAAKSRSGEAETLNFMGVAFRALGEWQKALEFYNKALLLRRELGDRDGQATILSNMGLVYDKLGEGLKALEFFKQALALHKAAGNRGGEATTLMNIGALPFSIGKWEMAIGYYSEALPIFRELGDRSAEAGTLNNIGLCHESMGQHQKALEFFDQALAVDRALETYTGEASTLSNIGLSYNSLGNREKAIEFFSQALTLHKTVGSLDGEANVLNNLMSFWEESNPSLAIFFGKKAVNALQDLRGNIKGLEREVQRSYLGSIEDTYRKLADLLISEERLPEAQQVLGLLKVEEYVEFVGSDPGFRALSERCDLTAQEAAANTRYQALADRATELARALSGLRDAGALPDEPRYQKLGTDFQAAKLSFQMLLREVADEFAKAAEKSTEAIATTAELKRLQSDLEGWEQGTVVLYTVVARENYRVILTTPTLQVARQANPKVKAADLNRLVLEFRSAVENPLVDARPLAERLYKTLIGPVEADLKKVAAKTLIWSLDGTLRYLPVAALHDGKQYVVERYQNVIVTLAGGPPRSGVFSSGDWRALGMGVSRTVVTKEGVAFRPLPYVPRELNGIVRDERQKPAAGVVPGKVLLNETFTSKTMGIELAEGSYPLVHIASHFSFKPGNDANSFLLLGDGDKLTLNRIKNSARPFFNGVQLLTLSACDTATDSGGNGRELEGFAVMAQRQGARAVLATLWPVQDESTADLMRQFYKIGMGTRRSTKAEALRQAQLALLQGDERGVSRHRTGDTSRSKTNGKASFSHPYFWAPFILIGDWR